jgi:hypothetical protein
MKAAQKFILSMLFAATAMAGYGPACAHATLQSATPAKDAQVSAPPKEITLRFNEKLEAVFSGIKLFDSAGRQVSTAKATLDPSNPSMMKLAVPALPSGSYKVEFIAVGNDGHRRKGEYFFSVK